MGPCSLDQGKAGLALSLISSLVVSPAGSSQSFPRQDRGFPHLSVPTGRLRFEKAFTNLLIIDLLEYSRLA